MIGIGIIAAAQFGRFPIGRAINWRASLSRQPWSKRLGDAVDSTDAPGQREMPQAARLIPWTLLTRFGDSGDATRGYPVDSTDESNSLNLITFE
jgi:hypothetical protein